jgi:hypothetical protein
LAIFLIVVPDLVEVVLVELPDEACEIAVLEMFRKYVFCEFLVLRHRQSSRRADLGAG